MKEKQHACTNTKKHTETTNNYEKHRSKQKQNYAQNTHKQT